MGIGVGLPGGSAGNVLKPEILIQLDGPRVVVTDVEPDGDCILSTSMFHSAPGKDSGNSAAPMVGMSGNVGDEVDTFAIVTERDEAGIADDLMILIPHVASERQRR